MQRISLAPELSATLSLVSCWIIRLLRFLHDFEEAPALLLGDRARFCDADQVADAALVLLVVDLESGALADRLLVEPVRFGRADLDDDRLVHLVRDHRPEADLALPAVGGCDGCRCRAVVAHEPSSSDLALALPRLRLGLGSSTATSASGASG